MRIDSVLAGAAVSFTSRKFRLYPYSPVLAHKTVKVESRLSGNLLSSQFDFTDLIAERVAYVLAVSRFVRI